MIKPEAVKPLDFKATAIQMRIDQFSWSEVFYFLPGSRERLKLLQEPSHQIFSKMNSQALKELFEKSESKVRNNKLIIVFS